MNRKPQGIEPLCPHCHLGRDEPCAEEHQSWVRVGGPTSWVQFQATDPDFVDFYTKYTGWAKGLTLDQFSGLLWLVGEFSMRLSASDFPTPEKHQFSGRLRAWAALRAIADFRNKPLGVEAVRQLIRNAMQEARSIATEAEERAELQRLKEKYE